MTSDVQIGQGDDISEIVQFSSNQRIQHASCTTKQHCRHFVRSGKFVIGSKQKQHSKCCWDKNVDCSVVDGRWCSWFVIGITFSIKNWTNAWLLLLPWGSCSTRQRLLSGGFSDVVGVVFPKHRLMNRACWHVVNKEVKHVHDSGLFGFNITQCNVVKENKMSRWVWR